MLFWLFWISFLLFFMPFFPLPIANMCHTAGLVTGILMGMIPFL
jgi:hypothetical protein